MSPNNGIYPVLVVYLTHEDRERLIRAFVNWPSVPTNVLIHKLPHEGQVQFVLLDQEPGGSVEGLLVDKGIVEQIEGKGNDGHSDPQ